MTENELGHGAPRHLQTHDVRIPHLHSILGAPIPFDWKTGFSIEKKLNFILPIKNQGNSESCVGQGWSYLMAVKNMEITGKYDEVSAKAIYSQIFQSGGGANIRDGGTLLENWGAILESIVSSHKPDGSVDEAFMEDRSWITPAITAMAKNLMALQIAQVPTNIESWACAIRDCGGIVFGVEGNNNGTWLSQKPQPPLLTTPQNELWGHCVAGFKVEKDSTGKNIDTPNSWGAIGGWQEIGEHWFDNNARFLFPAFTLVEKVNINNMNNLIFKDAKSSAIFVAQRCLNEADFIIKAKAIGITVPFLANGGVDWARASINGSVNLK